MRYAAAGLAVLMVLGVGSASAWWARAAATSPTAPAATPTVPAATPTAPAAAPNKPAYAAALIKDVPHVEAKPDFTGEACTEMVLKQLGKKWDHPEFQKAFAELNGLLAAEFDGNPLIEREYTESKKDESSSLCT